MADDATKTAADAMRFKLKQFNLVSIWLTSYYDSRRASIAFADEDGHLWYATDPHFQFCVFVASSQSAKAWLDSLSRRLAAKDLSNRFRIMLSED